MRRAWKLFLRLPVYLRVIAVCAYLIIGMAFGTWNYDVFSHPTSHAYGTRLVLFPWTTAVNEGWLCFSHCYIKRGEEFDLNLPSAYKNLFPENLANNSKRDYTITLAFVWPLKIVVNAVSLAVLYLGVIVVGIALVLNVVWLLFVSGIRVAVCWLFSLVT